MNRQYLKFFINGGLLGVAAWVLQLIIYKVLGAGSIQAYAASAVLTYIPLIIVNFLIQRSWIFSQPGTFWRFTIANLSIMVLVSLLAPVCRLFINLLLDHKWGDQGGFLIAALLGSVPSFLLMKLWVFKGQEKPA